MRIPSTLLLLLLPVYVWAQAKPYTIYIQLEDPNPPPKAFLQRIVNNKLVLDSALVSKGIYAFKGKIQEPYQVTLFLNKDWSNVLKSIAYSFKLYVEPGITQVHIRDALSSATVNGGPLNSDYNRVRKELKPTEDKIHHLAQAYTTLTQNQVQQAYDTIFAQQKAVLRPLIKRMSRSLVSLDLLADYGNYSPEYDQVAPLYAGLSEQVKRSQAGQQYAHLLSLLQRTALGAVAPDFTQADTSGQRISLHDFKGKYVLVDFWASWCEPCRAENPNVVAIYKQFKATNFTVLSVSLDQVKTPWLKAIWKDGLTWTQVSDLKGFKSPTVQQYGVQAIPQNFLISPNGIIVAKNLRGDSLRDELSKWLSNKP